MVNEALIASLQRAVDQAPEELELRLHLAQLLHAANRHAEALGHLNSVIQRDSGNSVALSLLGQVAASLESNEASGQAPTPCVQPALSTPEPTSEARALDVDDAGEANSGEDYDWNAAAAQFSDSLAAPFIERPLEISGGSGELEPPLEPAGEPVTLADVGGLQEVKDRLNESFLAPMRNAAIAKAFGKSLRGGLLLYGPPGCGKTYVARAVAGELQANFMAVTMTDILDAHVGGTEKNLKAVFDLARKNAPTVLFLDEVDALGLRRGSLTGSASWLRQMVNQLLLEMDSVSGNNDGLYVLAATNHPWDLDEALLRPGRLDRSVLVTPPDSRARESILRHHLQCRPIAGIDLAWITARTDGFSGADLEHLCTTAAEKAMMQSIERNEVIPVDMDHMRMAMAEVKPSTLPWLESARNVVRFSNDNGRYDDLAGYLRARKML
ncbi:tetratricopeptide repeat protein [Glutamicibacter protophormiae]|uniref:tetratricopeptide repeat protein n=1 Tax=Glutamicibacter protophormiae TaxID=37930 RepID=UPI002A81133D|nr:tetratricopeptide repeat protein [Glutamicibacter protophormiae]WPR64991.1 tetratricopeptide repeat protein [Glutamicibacter protophormiae]WPR68488.1 tetratricopeptide repeat protein [Glutamicibacter protophormiae]